MKQKRKTRVTREMVHQALEDKKNAPKAKKNVVIPGPWTNIESSLSIKPELRTTSGVAGGKISGAYTRADWWPEKGWYPIVINITSENIKEVVDSLGPDIYMAAWEKEIIKQKEQYGTIVLLSVEADNSKNEDATKRFISCKAKTNKKSIVGFSAVRKGKYVVISE